MVLGLAGPAWGTVIPVANPGFEDQPLGDGATGVGLPTGWNGSDAGWFNPTTSNYPGEAPEGQNAAWLNTNGVLWQTVAGTSITAGLTYELEVLVGYRLDTVTPNYSVELRANNQNGMLLASKNQTHVSPTQGTFSPLSLSFTAQAGDAFLGQALTIRMWSADVQTNFDDVNLSYVPEPTTFALLGCGLAWLSLGARRRPKP
jgi:hypothetical protein